MLKPFKEGDNIADVINSILDVVNKCECALREHHRLLTDTPKPEGQEYLPHKHIWVEDWVVDGKTGKKLTCCSICEKIKPEGQCTNQQEKCDHKPFKVLTPSCECQQENMHKDLSSDKVGFELRATKTGQMIGGVPQVDEASICESCVEECKATHIRKECSLFNPDKCYVCGKPIEDINANPELWGIYLPHIDGQTKHRHYHIKCLYPILKPPCTHKQGVPQEMTCSDCCKPMRKVATDSFFCDKCKKRGIIQRPEGYTHDDIYKQNTITATSKPACPQSPDGKHKWKWCPGTIVNNQLVKRAGQFCEICRAER